MKRILLCIIAALAATLHADGGFYVGIGAGYAMLANSLQSSYTFNNLSGGTQSSNNFASTLYGGYDFNRYVGLEVDYNVAFSGQVANAYNVNQQVINGVVVLHLPFGLFANALSGLSIFAKGGLGYSSLGFGGVNPSCTNCVNPPSIAAGFIPAFGAGVEYGFTDIGIRGEWNYNGSVTAPNVGSNQVAVSSNMFLLSVLYHF
jgi:hypothetical protein